MFLEVLTLVVALLALYLEVECRRGLLQPGMKRNEQVETFPNFV